MYIEYYIVENLLINYIIISCTYILTKRYDNKLKKTLGAFVGTLYSVAYIYNNLDILFTLPFKMLIMTFITLISFTYKSKRDYINTALVFYMVNVFISGSTFFIIYFTGIDHMKISFFIVCVYISCEILKHIYRDINTLRQIKQLKKTVTISLLGKSCSCEGLLDSGNLLKDPISNNDVVIIKSNILKDIIPEYLINCSFDDIDIIKAEELINVLDNEISTKIRLIPYKHVGSEKNNIILGIKADYIEVDKVKFGNIVLGISNFNDDNYDAILNPSILV